MAASAIPGTSDRRHPDWVAGISIGAVNAALIAGNPPEERVERLRQFWEAVSMSPLAIRSFTSLPIPDHSTHSLLNQTCALGILLFGAPHFFTPRFPPPMPWGVSRADAVSYYDVSPLKATLERPVDFDRIKRRRDAPECRGAFGSPRKPHNGNWNQH